jgi:mono/diheme cytochrome c family protein
MKKIFLIALGMSTALMFIITMGFTQDTAKTKSGEEEFKANCSSCHPNGGNVIKPGNPIKGSKKITNFKKFLSWIRTPLQPMPPFAPSMISDKQAKKLYDYVVNASKSEWK